MTMESDFVVTYEGFEAWLAAKPQREIVGVCNHIGECPLVAYINDYLPVEYFKVQVHESRMRAWTTVPAPPAWEQVTPDWARWFLEHIDKRGQRKISAGNALHWLRQCKEETCS